MLGSPPWRDRRLLERRHADAVVGATEAIEVTWTGSTAGVRDLGRVVSSSGGDLGGTLVAVNG